jgi:hypothetical protein
LLAATLVGSLIGFERTFVAGRPVFARIHLSACRPRF